MHRTIERHGKGSHANTESAKPICQALINLNQTEREELREQIEILLHDDAARLCVVSPQ
ncbi:MAG TPA: hypothetical protein VLY63_25620 [Anaerolineae bacterium]|nr:hypothetical protein [Anaerolineae bacterium]